MSKHYTPESLDRLKQYFKWPSRVPLPGSGQVLPFHMCQSESLAEDHSERMQPYEGDTGDETD